MSDLTNALARVEELEAENDRLRNDMGELMQWMIKRYNPPKQPQEQAHE